MITHQPTRTLLHKIGAALKWFEIGVFLILLVSIFWVYYSSFCSVESCKSTILSLTVSQFFGIFIPIIAFFFIARTGVSFTLSDKEKQGEPLFYTSLVGLFFAYIITGFFIQDILLLRGEARTDSAPFLFLVTLFFATTITLLADKSTWHRTTHFVRLRIAFSLIHLTMVIISPVLSILVGIPFLATAIFWKEDL